MPIEELFNTYLPQLAGILDKYWGRNWPSISIANTSAPRCSARERCASAADARKAFRRFWIGTLVISVLWAVGGNTPFYQLIYAVVPGTKFFRAPSTMLMVVAMATSVLAALGTERLLGEMVSRKFVYGWLIGAVVIALLASVGVLTTSDNPSPPDSVGPRWRS